LEPKINNLEEKEFKNKLHNEFLNVTCKNERKMKNLIK
jgi:hypothetical protein